MLNFKGVIFDLDGTVYRGKEAIPGAADFIRRLRDRDVAIRFVTNRANRPASEVCSQLLDMGLDSSPADVLTSADATAAYLKPGRVYAIGESGLIEALDRQGFIQDDQSPDYVIVSFDREFNFKKLATAVRLVSRGVQFIATNPDRALRLEHGISPGTGSLVAAVQAATGIAPLIIGKPERRIFDMVLKDMKLKASDVIAIGDNLDTDIPAGQVVGMRTVLILTGISTRDELAKAPVPPTWVVDTYAELEGILLG